MKRIVLLGGYSSEVPPLPIPNREVKLTHADGTAYLGGRVGSRLFKSGLAKDPTFLLLCHSCGGRFMSSPLPALIHVGSFAYDPLEESAMPLILTFPPLCPLPLPKGGALFFVAEGLLLFFLHIAPYLLHKT